MARWRHSLFIHGDQAEPRRRTCPAAQSVQPMDMFESRGVRSEEDPSDWFIGSQEVLTEQGNLRLDCFDDVLRQVEDESLVPLRTRTRTRARTWNRTRTDPLRRRLLPLQLSAATVKRHSDVGVCKEIMQFVTTY